MQTKVTVLLQEECFLSTRLRFALGKVKHFVGDAATELCSAIYCSPAVRYSKASLLRALENRRNWSEFRRLDLAEIVAGTKGALYGVGSSFTCPTGIDLAPSRLQQGVPCLQSLVTVAIMTHMPRDEHGYGIPFCNPLYG
jgi:hypothetical protein